MSTIPCSSGTSFATSTVMVRSRSVPKTRNRAVCSGMRICSSGFWNPCEPFSLSTPMISKGMPLTAIVWPIIAAGLAPSISGTCEPSTA